MADIPTVAADYPSGLCPETADLLPAYPEVYEKRGARCGATALFWPDVEACEAECELPAGHRPANIHRDEILGEWDSDELATTERVDTDGE